MNSLMNVWRRVVGLGPAIASADYGQILRHGLSSLTTAVGVVILLVGLVMFPLPIPLGLPMITIGLIIILNSSKTAKRWFLRWLRRKPNVKRKLRSVIGRRAKRVVKPAAA